MKLRLSFPRHKDAGQSVVELALILPLLTLLVLGTYDVSRAIRTKNMLINLSREGANLALRAPRTATSFQQIMTSLALAAAPLEMDKDGMMYVTEIKVKDGVRTVSQEAWQKNPAGPCSQINSSVPGGVAGSIPVADGTSVCIFEVVYSYESLLLPSYTPQLHSTTIF